MIIQNIKTKSKMAIKKKGIRRKKRDKDARKEKGTNFNLLLLLTFFSGVVLIISSYAWFYATLNVKVEFFKMVVSNHTGLFISLDGREFTSSVDVSRDILISGLRDTYPNNTNQWASAGMFAVSSNGLRDNNTYRPDMFAGFGIGEVDEDMQEKIEDEVNECIDNCDGRCKGVDDQTDEIECFNACVYKCEDIRDFFGSTVGLNTRLIREGNANPSNIYIAFDFFLKNVSGSPKSDNLYFNEGTSATYKDENHDDEDGIINSLRIGIIKVGSVPLKSDIRTIQNITCNNKCEMIIYEPNSTSHSENSIYRARKHDIALVDGEYMPTYAVIREGNDLELANGHAGSGIALDTQHFALQKTITDANFANPIFPIPNAITKMRAYVWVEGQDIDSLETSSRGGAMSIVINLIKDLAGYN